MITQLASQQAAAPPADPSAPPVQQNIPQGVPGATALPTPPAMPGTNLKGAVNQAISATAAIQKAAGAQVNAMPEYQQASGLASRVAASYQQAAQENARRSGQMEALATAPEPEHVAVPRLHELPSEPKEEPKDPLRVMGQFLPLLATFGALSSAAPATNALNAAAAAVNAVRGRDKEAADKAHQLWLDNLKLTLAQNEQLTGEYKLALDDRNATMSERMARIQSLAALNKDNIASAQLESGSLEPFMNLLKFRDEAAKPLQNILSFTLEDARARDIAADNSARGWVDENIRMIQAQAAAGQKAQVQPDDVAGQIFSSMMAQGKTFDQLPAADQATLKEIYKYRAAGAQTSGLSGLLTGGAATSDTGAGAAATTAAPAPAAPAPAPAPVAKAAAPQNPKDRVVGTVYPTPKGPLKWMGNGWQHP